MKVTIYKRDGNVQMITATFMDLSITNFRDMEKKT